MYDKKTKDLEEQGDMDSRACVCSIHCTDLHFKDKWGAEWVRGYGNTVVRLSDGQVGGWFNGQGLKVIY